MVVTLKQYVKHKDGTYASMLCSLETKQLLDTFTTQNLGLTDKIDPSTYHTTLIYSRTPVPETENYEFPSSVHANATGYELFDTKQGNKCLVLKLNCPVAHDINDALNKMGATSDYPSYKPHITICYDYNGKTDISDLPLPNFDIVFDDFEVKPLDDDYVPPNK